MVDDQSRSTETLWKLDIVETIGPISLSSAEETAAWLERFRVTLDARAAGVWRLNKLCLETLAHAFVTDLNENVGVEFRNATAVVRLSRLDLGIVKAIVDKSTEVSTLADGPQGSRIWLSRFGAECSIAAPIVKGCRILGVLASALSRELADPSVVRDVELVAAAIAPKLAELT